MGVAVAQMVGGLLVSRLASKWGSSSKSVPTVTEKVTGRDLVPSTEAETPKTYEIGGENKTKRGRSALTIKRDNSNNYNPMNL